MGDEMCIPAPHLENVAFPFPLHVGPKVQYNIEHDLAGHIEFFARCPIIFWFHVGFWPTSKQNAPHGPNTQVERQERVSAIYDVIEIEEQDIPQAHKSITTYTIFTSEFGYLSGRRR